MKKTLAYFLLLLLALPVFAKDERSLKTPDDGTATHQAGGSANVKWGGPELDAAKKKEKSPSERDASKEAKHAEQRKIKFESEVTDARRPEKAPAPASPWATFPSDAR